MMPNMASTLTGFEESLQFQIVKKTVVDHDLVESSQVEPVLWFEGILQPMNAQELLVKSEGQRKFKWWSLWTEMKLELDMVIKDTVGATYRVMGSTDWRVTDHSEYQLVEGPGIEAYEGPNQP